MVPYVWVFALKPDPPNIIKYKDIIGAQITDSDGEIISYNMKGENKIEFSTNKLGEYFITLND